jgi:hypothetical protein
LRRRGAGLRSIIIAEWKVMSLESPLRGRLADFFKVNPRGDAQGFERGQEKEGLGPVHTGNRASNPYSEVELK